MVYTMLFGNNTMLKEKKYPIIGSLIMLAAHVFLFYAWKYICSMEMAVKNADIVSAIINSAVAFSILIWLIYYYIIYKVRSKYSEVRNCNFIMNFPVMALSFFLYKRYFSLIVFLVNQDLDSLAADLGNFLAVVMAILLFVFLLVIEKTEYKENNGETEIIQ